MSCPFSPTGADDSASYPLVPIVNQRGTLSSGTSKEKPIPQPPPSRLMGNLSDLDPNFPSRVFQRFAELYGEIYQLDIGRRTIYLSSQRLVDEICDEERFHKDINRTLLEVRALTGDGLFTGAHADGYVLKEEKNWWKAHRLLVPAFGPLGLRKMFDDMLDITVQMVQRWDRQGEYHAIDCSDDFTRLAFDTIGLCSFGYRFNEFYSDDAHPFAKQMAEVLKLSGRRANRTDLGNKLHYWEEQQRQTDVKAMTDLVHQIVEERQSHPKPEAKDLLNTMLYATERHSGETLDRDNVVNNMITFLVAGHETTSATLSFLWYNLLKNPEAFHKAQQQVDEVVGDNVVTLDMLPKLTYIDACLKETLRLNSPIGVFSVIPNTDTYLADGTYAVKRGEVIVVNVKGRSIHDQEIESTDAPYAGLHHDPVVWGDDHNDFRPERFLNGGFQKLPPNSWKPFGNGVRACIGRAFAEQEMLINTAMILQRFIPEMADPKYDLVLRSTLTVKPEGFYIKVRRRAGKSLYAGVPGSLSSSTAGATSSTPGTHATTSGGQHENVKIFFGGNSGTCEGFAQSLQTGFSERGVKCDIANLDSATGNLKKDEVNFFITASYEGKPPDNAKVFVSWLEGLKADNELDGVKYSVMGVGNADWASTFHRIPKFVDRRLGEVGAHCIVPAGYADVKTDLLGPFDDWAETVYNAVLGEAGSSASDKPSIKAVIEKSKLAGELGDTDMGIGTVLQNMEIADTSVGAAKRHMEVRLPEGMAYQAGDYLAVQPRNPEEAVMRIMRYYGFVEHTTVTIQGSKKTFLPSAPTLVTAFLSEYVELGTPLTKRQLKIIAGYATHGQKPALDTLQDDDSTWAEVLKKRYTIIDILEEHKVDLPFEAFIDMLLPLAPRQYSIASSPLAPGQVDTVAIVYDHHTSPALSGHGVFEGVCSSFLASRKVGDHISCSVRSTNVNFRLPANPETPIILFAAGTGIAPMRAFLQERAALASVGGRTLAPALLFFGCRDAEKDYLYRDQLGEWEKMGIVTARPAFSRTEKKYVQDSIWEDRDKVASLFKGGAKIYLCGSAAKLGQSCAAVCKKIYREHASASEEEAEKWLDSVKTDRYISDVY